MRLRRLVLAVRRALALLPAGAAAPLAGFMGLLVGGAAQAVELPEQRADGMYHLYDGGGVRAQGPALLVRKNIADKFALSGTYYVDMVSNASIDVLTNASPYKETRHEYGLGADYVYRDALMSVSATRSKEPDYTADALNLDLSQEVFGGMTTVALGFTRGSDKVGRKNAPEFSESARHWRYRFGLTQILTPRWLAAMNFEAVSDDGFLGNPYRAARVFGAAVPERVPSTRSSRAVKFRVLGDLGSRDAVSADYRYFWDNWGIRAHTLGAGYSRYFGSAWLADATIRFHTQDAATFYSDNFMTETTYISRNRQLATFSNVGPGVKLSYRYAQVPGKYDIRINGAYELLHFRYDDFTDVRNGQLYSFNAHIVQFYVSANF